MKQIPKKLHIPLIYLVLAVVTFIAFEPVRHNEFVEYDDPSYVTRNPYVKVGITLKSVVWAFTTPHFNTWNPLTQLSHMLDCQLFGLNAGWHHLTSLLFHILSTLLLFGVLKRMTGAIWASAFVAAAFALHPLRVESVAWVAERKDVLSAFFWMLTMIAYLRYLERPGVQRYLLIALALCLGLMAKPMLVTLPFVLLLLDYWPLGRFQWGLQSDDKTLPQSESTGLLCNMSSARSLIVEKIPLFVIIAVFSVITFIVHQKWGALTPTERLPLNARCANVLVSYISYIGKMIWPSRLAVLYPYKAMNVVSWRPIICFVILFVVSRDIIGTARRQPYLLVGWLWYLGTLIPVIGFVQTGSHAMADRFTYLPSIGILIMIAWRAAELLPKWRYRKIGLKIAATILLAAVFMCTRVQIRYWKDTFTLFEHAVEATENNYIMHNNYGSLLAKKGQFDQAAKHFSESLRIRPDYVKAYTNLANIFASQGKADQAVEYYDKALSYDSDKAKALHNLAGLYLKQGKINDAIEYYNKALAVDPQMPEAHAMLGYIQLNWGYFGKAITHFEQALKVAPDLRAAQEGLAKATSRKKVVEKAVIPWLESLQKDPNQPELHNKLATILNRQGELTKAVYHWNKASQLKPGWPEVLNSLARAEAAHTNKSFYDPNHAVQLAQQACQLTDYENPKMLDTLSIAYAAVGEFDKAVEIAEKALEIYASSGQNNRADDLRKRIEMFKAAQPYSQ